MKVNVTEYGNIKEILKYPSHHVGIAAMASATGISVNTDGKKIIPAGTLVKGLGTATVTAANDATTEGVILSDVDVTYGDAPCTVVVHGFINLANIPVAPTTAAKAALPMIKFI